MSKRRTSRKLAMQMLYQADMRPNDVASIIQNIKGNQTYIPDTRELAVNLTEGAWANRKESDSLITKYSKGWDISRINLVDKSLLRLAIYEIKHTETPETVVINEIIEMVLDMFEDVMKIGRAHV